MPFRILVGLLTASSLSLASLASANAADTNYVDLFKKSVIRCIHSTVNPEKANVEVIKGPDVAGEITTIRLKTYYDGFVKKNVMETELMIRQAGSIRQMKINQLSDTGTSVGHCDLEKSWRDF